MSKNTTPIYRKALEEEHSALASIIDACFSGSPRKEPERALDAEDLDRAAADAAEAKVVDQIAGEDRAALMKQCLQVAANHANVQENQRVRRDTRIMRLNHKRLMLGCLQTMYWRKHDLEVSLGL